MSYNPPTVPCETCGTPTAYEGTKRCNNCWEVEARLPSYLASANGWAFVRQHIPKLDDWVDGQPDAWDYEVVLRDNGVEVVWCDKLVDGDGNELPAGELAEWSMSWKYGVMGLGRTTETIARKAAAMFASLWLRGVSASFADKLVDGFICFLERQENTQLVFLAELDRYSDGRPFFRYTREGFCNNESMFCRAEERIIEALDVQPDEEVIVTFTKRKKV